MITDIKKSLKSFGIESWIKGSSLYEIYLRLFYQDYIKSRRKEIEFYQTILKPKNINLIFDIGANGGDKADRFLRTGANAKVICVEPDQYCCEILKTRFRNNSNKITILNTAVSDSIENKVFFVHQKGSAYNTLSEKWATQVSEKNQNTDVINIQKYNIQTTTIDALISVYGKPDFIKIDIEGYEINAIRGLNCKIPFITFELNLPQFREEGIECVDKLIAIDSNASFNFFFDCQRGLELAENVDAKEFKTFLAETELNYIEVFCQMDCDKI